MIRYEMLSLWICLALVSYFLGIFLRQRLESIAKAFLNWLTNPLLLLSGILYITLGIYTNTYLFLVMDVVSVTVLLLYSCLAYIIAFVIPYIARQSLPRCKTIANHCAIPHCLLSTISARYALNRPASDIASIAPILLVIFSSIPFIIEFMYKAVRDILRRRFQQIEEEKGKQMSRVGTQASLQNVVQSHSSTAECPMQTDTTSQHKALDSNKPILVHEQKVTCL